VGNLVHVTTTTRVLDDGVENSLSGTTEYYVYSGTHSLLCVEATFRTDEITNDQKAWGNIHIMVADREAGTWPTPIGYSRMEKFHKVSEIVHPYSEWALWALLEEIFKCAIESLYLYERKV
jgi:hypothetical protein